MRNTKNSPNGSFFVHATNSNDKNQIISFNQEVSAYMHIDFSLESKSIFCACNYMHKFKQYDKINHTKIK